MLQSINPLLDHSISPVLFSDYHTHPQGHRVQPYSQGLLQPWVDQARKLGLTDIAFTDHDRFHQGVDFSEIERLRAANPDIKIRAGIELDNDPVHSGRGRRWVEQNWDQLDFVLGSVHFLDHAQMFDTVPSGALQFEGRDIDSLYKVYFGRVRDMAASGLVDCLAHLDLIKIHGHRSIAPITDLIEETLDFIRSRDLAIELSTAGWRKPVNELYPGDEIIQLASAKGVPFTTASDAHSHVQLGENYESLAEKMSVLGITEACIYQSHRRTAVPLKTQLSRRNESPG